MFVVEVIVKYRVFISKSLLEDIYCNCDKYPKDETGGRLIGHLSVNRKSIDIIVRHLIGAGDNAKRTRTSFFQDRAEQAKKFRDLYYEDNTLNHLGNWHSHHCNGYPTLSSGDIETYTKTVNHKNHNLDMFVALLVIPGKGSKKYDFKVFVLNRGHSKVIEIDKSDTMFFTNSTHISSKRNRQRAIDNNIISTLFPKFKPFLAGSMFYWKGVIKFGKKNCGVVLIYNKKTGYWMLSASNYLKCVQSINNKKYRSAGKMLFTFYRDALKYRQAFVHSSVKIKAGSRRI